MRPSMITAFIGIPNLRRSNKLCRLFFCDQASPMQSAVLTVYARKAWFNLRAGGSLFNYPSQKKLKEIIIRYGPRAVLQISQLPAYCD